MSGVRLLLNSGTIAPSFDASEWALPVFRIWSRLFDDPDGKSALSLLGCSEWRQLLNSHELDARSDEAPASANSTANKSSVATFKPVEQLLKGAFHQCGPA
jgi:hypothetical protein